MMHDSIEDFSVVPSKRQLKKMSFFYGPYNSFYNMHKHMKFDPRKVNTWCALREQILQKDENMTVYFNQTVADTKINKSSGSNIDCRRLQRLHRPVVKQISTRHTRVTDLASENASMIDQCEPEVAELDLGWVK